MFLIIPRLWLIYRENDRSQIPIDPSFSARKFFRHVCYCFYFDFLKSLLSRFRSFVQLSGSMRLTLRVLAFLIII